VVGGSYFLDSVQLSNDLQFPETTQVLYSDGSVLARLGEQTRYALPYDRIEDPIKEAIVASEDQTFWSNAGIDVGSVVRAAWNNFTGGQIQGGSTITQQYARIAYELGGVTYKRKIQEAVLAWKINQTMDKTQILEAYLNSVSFGRQAYGVEAAAKAFFGKTRTVDNKAPKKNQLTLAEAIVLVAMVKQPYPDPKDPEGSPGFDPTVSDAAASKAHGRFDYVRDQLVSTGKLSAADAAKLEFPDTVIPYEPEGNGMEGPGGHIVNQVLSELTHNPDSPFYQSKNWKYIEEGGYQIYTTINKSAQAAAVKAASYSSGTIMNKQPKKLQAALVAVEPGTGRVLAYFGGDDGTGSDFAGTYLDENDDMLGVGFHPPGSSFKVYTLAAALKDNISLNSYWNWNPHDMQGRTGNNQVKNSSGEGCGDIPPGDPTPCSLLQSTISSLNVTFYQVALTVGPANVLTMARDAGVTTMWNDGRKPIDLKSQQDLGAVVPSQFNTELAIGQYPITVLDHANGMATFAAAGRHADAHFVEKVVKSDQIIYGETLPPPDEDRLLTPQQVNDLTFALSQVHAAQTSFGWDTAGKTGTWEWGKDKSQNAHAWMVGFTRKLAAAVWVGNRGDEAALKDASGNKIYGAGIPATIWRQFLGDATKAMKLSSDKSQFNPPNYLGDVMPPGAVPSPQPQNPNWPPGFPTIPGWPPTRNNGPGQ
jgi:membrane peptidoglycan carboxypeptidase